MPSRTPEEHDKLVNPRCSHEDKTDFYLLSVPQAQPVCQVSAQLHALAIRVGGAAAQSPAEERRWAVTTTGQLQGLVLKQKSLTSCWRTGNSKQCLKCTSTADEVWICPFVCFNNIPNCLSSLLYCSVFLNTAVSSPQIPHKN